MLHTPSADSKGCLVCRSQIGTNSSGRSGIKQETDCHRGLKKATANNIAAERFAPPTFLDDRAELPKCLAIEADADISDFARQTVEPPIPGRSRCPRGKGHRQSQNLRTIPVEWPRVAFLRSASEISFWLIPPSANPRQHAHPRGSLLSLRGTNSSSDALWHGGLDFAERPGDLGRDRSYQTRQLDSLASWSLPGRLPAALDCRGCTPGQSHQHTPVLYLISS